MHLFSQLLDPADVIKYEALHMQDQDRRQVFEIDLFCSIHTDSFGRHVIMHDFGEGHVTDGIFDGMDGVGLDIQR